MRSAHWILGLGGPSAKRCRESHLPFKFVRVGEIVLNTCSAQYFQVMIMRVWEAEHEDGVEKLGLCRGIMISLIR
jgi:hypothetical protein